MDPQIAALMKAMASLMTMVENTTCQIRGLCHEGLTHALEPEANLLTLIAIDDLATDLENATMDCRLRMELSVGVQQEQSADEHNVDANDIVPVDFSPPDSEYELEPEEEYHYIGSDRDI